MNLIERYIYEVTRHLSPSQQEDVANELRASIEDMVTAKMKKKSDEEKIIKEVLTELGDPKLLATQYSDQKQYLIGPMWYEVYICTLKRILIIVPPIVLVVLLFIALMGDVTNYVQMIIQSIGGAIQSGVQIFFWTTLTFIVMERVGTNPKELMDKKTKSWSIEDLPELPKKRQIKFGEALGSVIFLVIGIVFVIFSDRLIDLEINGASTPILNPELWNLWLPLFLALCFLTLIQEILKLKIGNWTTGLTISNVILSIFAISYLLILVSTQTIFNPEFSEFMAVKINENNPNPIDDWAKWTIGISVLVTIIVYIYEGIKSIQLNHQYRKFIKES